MTPSSIWWEQIGCSLRFLSAAAAVLRDGRSMVLCVPRGIPWRQTFLDNLDIRRAALGCDRRMLRRSWKAGQEPGRFVLEELCDSAVSAEYWPGQSYGEYLAALPGLTLNECCVWISGIRDKADLIRWAEFVRGYEKAAGDQPHAAFVLEFAGEAPEQLPLPKIEYRLQGFECRVFCLELAAALENTALAPYQAELALAIAGPDPEFAAALLLQGSALLHSTAAAAETAALDGRRSDGSDFPTHSDQQIAACARKAAMSLLFPILEQQRLNFIVAHQAALECRLPFTTTGGQTITDPFDLEIGPLSHLVSTLHDSISPEQAEIIRLCHRVRNLLAHNKSVPYPDISRLLALQS